MQVTTEVANSLSRVVSGGGSARPCCGRPSNEAAPSAEVLARNLRRLDPSELVLMLSSSTGHRPNSVCALPSERTLRGFYCRVNSLQANAELSGWLGRRHEVAPLASPLERRVRLTASTRVVAPPGCMQTSLCRSVALCDTGWRMNRATLFPKIWLDCTAQTTMYRYAGRGAVTRTTLRELPTLRASPTACNPPASNEGKRSCTNTWRGRHGTATPAHRTTDLAPTAICGVTDRAVTRETDGA